MRLFWLRRLLGLTMIVEGVSTLTGIRYALKYKRPLNLKVGEKIARENFRRLTQ